MSGEDNANPSKWLVFCGVAGWIGCIASAVGGVIGVLIVESHNWVSETISKLAIGPYGWIQDVGLDLLAAGLIFCGLGLFSWNQSGMGWKIGAGCLLLLGIDMFLIAEYDQYAGELGEGGTVHYYCVLTMYALFSLALLALIQDIRDLSRKAFWWTLAVLALWLTICPVFMFLLPTSIDGLVERFLGLLLLSWIAMVSSFLVRAGQGKLPQPSH